MDFLIDCTIVVSTHMDLIVNSIKTIHMSHCVRLKKLSDLLPVEFVHTLFSNVIDGVIEQL